MDNRKKILFGLIAGIIFIIAFILNLLFPPKPFIKSVHAVGYTGSFVITSGSLNQTIAEHDSALYDWLENQGAVDPSYTYNNFILDLSKAYIGSRTGIDGTIIDFAIDGLYNALLDQAFSYDSSSGFITYPNTADSFLRDFSHQYGFDSGEYPASIGHWYRLPWSDTELKRSVSSSVSPTYLTRIYNNGGVQYLFGTFQNGNFTVIGKNTSNNYTLVSKTGETLYNGSVNSGFYYRGTFSIDGLGSFLVNNGYVYNESYAVNGTSFQAAMDDLYGEEINTEPVFNGKVYIDSGSGSPINLTSVPGNNGRSASIARNTDINNNITYNYGGYNDIILSPEFKDIPNNHDYELPIYPEIPHDLPEVEIQYPSVEQNQEIQTGLNGLNSLWVILLTMGGSFILLKVIL